jgi:hypothetical protein
MQAELGEAYRLYFLEDKEGRPVAVVLPVAAVDLQLPGGQEVGLGDTPSHKYQHV